MGEYDKLISQGVYCESCGCFTGSESGHPTLCEGCDKVSHDTDIENAIERGEKI